MNRNSRSTIVLGLTALLAVLAVTARASAMNDPVTGRWLTRDPRTYDVQQVQQIAEFAELHRHTSPGVGTGRSGKLAPTLEVRPPDRAARWTGSFGWLPDSPSGLYEAMASCPTGHSDPSGLADCEPIGTCRFNYTTSGCTYSPKSYIHPE